MAPGCVASAPGLSRYSAVLAAGLPSISRLPPGVGLNHRLVHFQHLFSSSGYAAGYYVYLWAEVLDADGFEAFREAGDPFDPVLAAKLRRHIYAAGNSVEPGAAYAAFRGRAPVVEALLRKRGLVPELVPELVPAPLPAPVPA